MVDLSRDEYWTLIKEHDASLAGQPSWSNRILPILFGIPFLSPFLKIYATSSATAKDYRYAGYISLYIGNLEQEVPIWVTARKVIFDDWRLCNFPEIANSSQSHLEFNPAYWLPDISFEVWQYVE